MDLILQKNENILCEKKTKKEKIEMEKCVDIETE